MPGTAWAPLTTINHGPTVANVNGAYAPPNGFSSLTPLLRKC